MKKYYAIGNLYKVSPEKGTECTQVCKVFIMHFFFWTITFFFLEINAKQSQKIYLLSRFPANIFNCTYYKMDLFCV